MPEFLNLRGSQGMLETKGWHEPVHDALQNAGKWSDTNSSSDKYGMLSTKNMAGWRPVRTVNANLDETISRQKYALLRYHTRKVQSGTCKNDPGLPRETASC